MTVQWGKITSEDIIGPVKGKLISGSSRRLLNGVSTDSRNVCAGQIFIALKGENFDGHDFVKQAIEKGASCAIVETGANIEKDEITNAAIIGVPDTLNALGDLAQWWKRQFDAPVITITGSMGKTTTKEMVSSILELQGRILKNEGNFNNLIGLPLTLLQLNERHRQVVLEMGMNRPGEIRRLTEISDPDFGLITNVGRVHLEGVGNLKGVARAKTEMLEVIREESTVILNGDDRVLTVAASRYNKKTCTFGTASENDIRIRDVDDLGIEGSEFRIDWEGGSFPVRIRVPGYHNILNATAAASIAVKMDIPFENIAEGLAEYRGTRGRLTPVILLNDVLLLDDTYNSNPSSLKAVLQASKKMAGENRGIIAGLGEMLELGEETVKAHIEAGEMVAETGVRYFLAMGEHARHMLRGAIDKGFPSDKVMEAKSHEDMVKKIKDVLKKNDLILLKGSRKIGLDRVVRGLMKDECKGE